MDDIELKSTLKKQKIPFNEAVDKKIAYLKSDEVFLNSGDEYVSVFKNLYKPSETDEFLKSFTETQNKAPTGMQNNPEPPKMSIADRIAALRGAVYVSPEYRRK